MKQPSQSEKFKEAAREHGAADSEEAFDKALRKVGSAKPSPKAKQKPQGKQED